VNRTLVVVILVALSSPVAAEELLAPDQPIPDVIDHYIGLKLKQASVTPAPQADATTLVRRLTLDLAGRIPTPAEARAYVESKDADKQSKLIDRLMASPEFVRHSATEFDALLQNSSDQAPSLRKYLLAAVKENRPWDRMFRDLMGVAPDPNRPDEFVLKRLGDLDVLTRDVTSVFFGVNVMCAQCHKHPYVPSITQDYYFGMKSFFARSIDFQGQLWERKYAQVQYKTRGGEVRTPKLMFLSGAVLDEPKLDVPDLNKALQEETKHIEELRKNFARTKEYPPKPKVNNREQLIDVALRPAERDRFARSIVNRLWYRFHGYGLVMRLDQMHAKNPPSHPELLEWLARDFVAHDYDLRRLMRGLVASQTYSRGSRWDKEESPAPELFAVANLRPLTPMQFGVSVLLANHPTGLPTDAGQRERTLDMLEAAAEKQFGSLIERPQDGFQVNVQEALRLSNDESLLKVLGGDLVGQLVPIRDRRRQIETAVWAVLSRPPTDEEVRLLGGYVARHTVGDTERERQAREFRERREAAERAKARAADLTKEIDGLRSRHCDEAVRAVLGQTERYLAAVAELQLAGPGTVDTPERAATRHGLDVGYLRRWLAYLSRPVGSAGTPAPQAAEAVRKGLYTTKVNDFGGNKTVTGWGSSATPWLIANPAKEPMRFATLTLPPRSISTHPSPTLAGAIGWRSPITGTVTVTGKVADVDPNCGNGVGWSVELLHDGSKQVLASGVIDNGKSATLPGLAAVKVREGDLLSLIVDARDGNHACDSTHVEIVVTETSGKGRKWDLTTDVVDSIQAANPHADGQGNAVVWHFYAIAGGAAPALPPSIPPESVLARWPTAVARLRGKPVDAGREELSKIAAEAQKLLLAPTVPAKDEADAALYHELIGVSGPLFNGVDFSASLDGEAKGKLTKWNTDLAEARRVAAQPLPTAAEDPTQSALRQMVWALLTGAEFRFNY
jgi:Protein of unknown function (DUF1549)/Protein of unknown function (DUF1553)